MDKATLYLDDAGEWRWRRTAENGEEVAASSEGYVDKTDAVENFDRINGPHAPALDGR